MGDKKYDGGVPYYLIKWDGWNDPADQTWEPMENLDSCPDLLKEFEAKWKAKKDNEQLFPRELFYKKCEGLKCPLKECSSFYKTGLWTRHGLLTHVASHFKHDLIRLNKRYCCHKVKVHKYRLSHIATMHNGVESMLKTLYPEIFEILCKTLSKAKDVIEE